MPEHVAKKKSKPTINTFDFSFFEKHNGKHDRAMKVAIVTCKSYIKLSMLAYRKIKGPEYFKVGIDINNRVICVSPAVENEPFVIKPTASQIERRCIFIVRRIGMTKPQLNWGSVKKFLEKKKEPPSGKMKLVWQPQHFNIGGSMSMNDVKSLSHSKWRCKYHIVFAPKYRRQIIYGRIKADVGKILRDLCKRKNVEIIEAECCPDHIHMLVTIPPHLSVSSFMGYLKSKSSLMIFDKHANLKYKYGNRHFWCRGYYVDTVGRYEGAIKEYIRNQLQEDIAQDTLNFKEYTDPFTGEPVK